MPSVNLTVLRDSVRKYTGSPNENQLATMEIDGAINHFYREVLPSLASLEELKGLYSFNANDQAEQALPDSVVVVRPPCMIDNMIAGFYYDPVLFWVKHAGASEGVPEDVLLVGRILHLGPPADANGPYAVRMVSTDKPSALVSPGDTLIADRFKDSVELGASVSILLKREDDEAVTLLNQHLVSFVGALHALGVQTDLQAAKERLEKEG